MVEDLVTRLVWQGCPAGRTGSLCTTGTPSTRPWGDAVTYCADLEWGGRSDWRLPDEFELHSLMNPGLSTPSANPDVFPAAPTSGIYWSSSTTTASANTAWRLELATGTIGATPKSQPHMTLCVRGLPTAARHWTVSSPPAGRVVEDSATGLSWQGCAAGRSGAACTGTSTTFNHEGAIDYCANLSHGGFADWRLPDVTELLSIVHHNRSEAGFDETRFPATPTESMFWSSTTYAPSPASARGIDFADGIGSSELKTFAYAFVRCVRGGLEEGFLCMDDPVCISGVCNISDGRCASGGK
jgi:hypothetical protein